MTRSYGRSESAASVRTLEVTPLGTDLATALVRSMVCACGQDARRVVIERVPLAHDWDVDARNARRHAYPVKVTAWCGSTEAHPFDGTDTARPDDVAMFEEDM